MNERIKHKIKSNTLLLKSTTLVLCLSFGVYLTAMSLQPSLNVCAQNQSTVTSDLSAASSMATCPSTNNEVSWLAWLTSKSTSNQFHFLDLLELLSQFNADDED